jgi:hypothetical protein
MQHSRMRCIHVDMRPSSHTQWAAHSLSAAHTAVRFCCHYDNHIQHMSLYTYIVGRGLICLQNASNATMLPLAAWYVLLCRCRQ